MAHFGKALDNGLDILEALQEAEGPLAYGELRTKVGLRPASFARYLKLLTSRGYVMQSTGGPYAIGWRSIQLGLAGLSRTAFHGLVRPHLEEIARVTEESAELAVFESEHFLFLDREECPRSVVLKARPGSRFGISDHTAIGWVAMAHGWKGRPTIAEAKLKPVRSDGFHGKLQNDNEVYRGAAALFDHAGGCVGCICVAAPAFRVGAREKKLFRKLLSEHARNISAKLGFRG